MAGSNPTIIIPKRFGDPTVTIEINNIKYTYPTGVVIEPEYEVYEVIKAALLLEPQLDPNAGLSGAVEEVLSALAEKAVKMEGHINSLDGEHDVFRGRIEALEEGAGAGGGGSKMYIHSLKNDKMTFNFCCSQSTPFTLDTLKPYVKGLLSSLNCVSFDGIPGYGYVMNSSYENIMASALSALSLTQNAPICLMGADPTNHKLTNLGSIEEFVDTVVEI